jgi:hypothetical protein
VIDIAANWLVSALAFGGTSLYGVESSRRSAVAAVTVNPIRWWTTRAFGRHPLARGADRVEAWAIVVGILMLIVAVYPAMGVGQLGYAARSHAIAVEAATRHPVEATAVGTSRSDPSMSDSTTATFLVPVRWLAQNTTHDATTKVEQPVKAGDKVRIWLDDEGRITSAPLTEADARIEMIGTVVLSWLLACAMVGGAFVVLRRALHRSRDRGWERGLLELVDNGGGSTTRKS